MDHQIHAGPEGGALAGDVADEAPARQSAARFALEKWYLDTVTPEGEACIAYWASVAWHGISLTWHNATRYALEQSPVERSSIRGAPAPVVIGQSLNWQSDRIGVSASYECTSPPASLVLLDEPAGRIAWECVAPAGRARIAVDAAVIAGTGYAERLTMTIAPWSLPIDELRWGRWISDDAAASVVWIDWRGAVTRRWAIVNGHPAADVAVSDHGVAVGGARLTHVHPRVLHERAISRFLQQIPTLAALASHIPLAWEERKWCARSTWSDASGHTRHGWALYETVRLR